MHSYKRKFPYVVATTLAISLVMYFFAAVGHGHEWMAPQSAANRDNPIAATSSSLTKGKKLFLSNCAYCHGEDTRGMTAEEAGLDTSPPDLKKRLDNHTDGDFFWKIQQGRGEMPSFQESLSEQEIWHVINFIKSR